MPRLLSVSKTVRQIEDGSKDVTRRDGWLSAKAGDVVELVEWSPRVGSRWVCCCGWLGPTLPPSFPIGGIRYPGQTPSPPCDVHAHAARLGHAIQFRAPRRLGLRRIVSVHRERLGDISEDDVRREGFPGMAPADFVAMYCAPGKPDPERVVTRIELILPDSPEHRAQGDAEG